MKMALDDFGTGYSNSDVLVFGSYNFIKIDQLLIRNIHLSRAARTLVESMVGYAHENGIKVIAEGVETREQLEYLGRHGCDYVQGFYFSRPLPQQEFEKLLHELQEEEGKEQAEPDVTITDLISMTRF